MTEADRVLCRVTAAWLAACWRAAGALGLGAGLLAALGLLLPAGPQGTLRLAATAGCALALLLSLPERVLALRLAFDAALFADLAAAGDHGPAGMPCPAAAGVAARAGAVDSPAPPASLGRLDGALQALGLRDAVEPPRSLRARVDGARRLSRQHLGLVLAQVSAVALAGLALGVGRTA